MRQYHIKTTTITTLYEVKQRVAWGFSCQLPYSSPTGNLLRDPPLHSNKNLLHFFAKSDRSKAKHFSIVPDSFYHFINLKMGEIYRSRDL